MKVNPTNPPNPPDPVPPAPGVAAQVSPQALEESIAASATAPRVTLAELEANIADVEFVVFVTKRGKVLRWCVLTTASGFAVTGDPSAAVSPANDDQATGELIARKNAVDKLWALMGYALAERLHAVPVGSPLGGHDHMVDHDRATDDGMPPRRLTTAEHEALGHVYDAARDVWRVPERAGGTD